MDGTRHHGLQNASVCRCTSHPPLLALALILGLIISLSSIAQVVAPTYYKDNGVMRLEINGPPPFCPGCEEWGCPPCFQPSGPFPFVSSMWITGQHVMPHDNAGADLSMTTRGPTGNAWNPTQGGDCLSNPSWLTGYVENLVIDGLPSANGTRLDVDPRMYNDYSYGGPESCRGHGFRAPTKFKFSVAVGDGLRYAREHAVLEMSIKKEPGTPDLVKAASELPAAYPYASVMRYAYYSVDGITFYPLTPPGYGNDVMGWPLLVNYHPPGGTARCVYASTQWNAIQNPHLGIGMGFCAKRPVSGGFSHRLSTTHLTLIWLVGAPNSNELITDENWHTVRRMMGVGNLNTFRAVYQEALGKYPDWGWDSYICGNGVVEPGETCDGGACCNSSCQNICFAENWYTVYRTYDGYDHDLKYPGWTPGGWVEGPVFQAANIAGPGRHALFTCWLGHDSFVSSDINCEGQSHLSRIGYVWTGWATGRSPFYRCRIWGNGEHFISRDANCEGQHNEALLGYTY